ncbi:Flagellar biosynthetic protein FliR [Buchnera aphidicola (Pterocallis alni)]|uniref:flagellar biosynthetic protein FliR n=1 Tax=Buchnera aphidicola TaxID=9 RepID=UPI003464C45B
MFIYKPFLLDWNALVIVIFRIFSTIYIVSIFGDTIVDIKIKFFLSICIALLIFPFISYHQVILLSILGVLIFIKQIFIGFFIGWLINVILSITIVMGEIISLQIGLSCINSLNLSIYMNISTISSLLNMLLLLLFLSMNGHLLIIYLIAKSFDFIPINDFLFNIHYLFSFIQIFNKVFIFGVILSLPIIIIVFLLNILIGFLSKMSYPMSVFYIGFPISVLLSMMILLFSNAIIINSLIYLIKYLLNFLLYSLRTYK